MKRRVAALALVFCFFFSCLTFARPQRVSALGPVIVVDGVPIDLSTIAYLLTGAAVKSGAVKQGQGSTAYTGVLNLVKKANDTADKPFAALRAIEGDCFHLALCNGAQYIETVPSKIKEFFSTVSADSALDSTMTNVSNDYNFSPDSPATVAIPCTVTLPASSVATGAYILLSDGNRISIGMPARTSTMSQSCWNQGGSVYFQISGWPSCCEGTGTAVSYNYTGSGSGVISSQKDCTGAWTSGWPGSTDWGSDTDDVPATTKKVAIPYVPGQTITGDGTRYFPKTLDDRKTCGDSFPLGTDTTETGDDLPENWGNGGSLNKDTGEFKLPGLGKLGNFLTNGLKTILNYLNYLQGIKDLSTAIWSLFQGILQNILTAIGNIAQGIWDFFQPTLENIVTLLKNMAHDIFVELSTIASTLGDILSKLGDVASSLGQAIANVASETWDLFKEALQNILEGIGNLAESVWEKFQDVFPKIQEAIQDLPSEIWDPGNVDIDPTPLKNLGYDFSNKFPFSLPWDFSRIWTSLSNEGLAPVFEFVLPSQNVDYKVSFDDVFGSTVMPIVRQIELLLFAIGMIILTPKLLSGGGDQ